MRDLTSIEAMLPDLKNRLAFMYFNNVEKAKHLITVDKRPYFIAEVHLNTIDVLLTCDPDVEEVNYHLNKVQEYLRTCVLPEICDPEVLELACQSDTIDPTFWVPDDIECEVTTTTTTTSTTTTTTAPPVLYELFATVTSFTEPDLVTYMHSTTTQEEVILKAEVDSYKQFILIEETFPKTLTAIYYYSYALGIYILTNKLSEFTYTNPTGFKKYQYNGAKRGTTKVKLIFA